MHTLNGDTIMTAREWTKATAAEAERVLKAHFGDRLTVERGNATFNDISATVKFVFHQVGEDGTAKNTDREDFARNTSYVTGIKAEDFGRTFKHRGETYKIVGWNYRAKKFPINVTRADGRRFKFPLSTVVSSLATS